MPRHGFISRGNLEHFKATRRVPFPHMGPADTAVWTAALDLKLMPAGEWQYDVRLGGVGADLVDDEHSHKPMWETLLRKRVDAVGIIQARPWLVEVKPVASFAALGQVLGYCWLWENEKGATPKPVPVVVCAWEDADLRPIFAAYGVRVVSLPRALAEQLLG